MDLPILCIDITEDWLIDLPDKISKSRTRDYRFYKSRFGSNGCWVTTRNRPLSEKEMTLLLNQFAFIGLIEFGVGNTFKEIEQHNLISFLNRFPARSQASTILGPVMLIESESHVAWTLPPSASPQEVYLKYKRECFIYAAKEKQQQIAPLLANIETTTLRELLAALCGCPLAPEIAIITFPDKLWGIHPHYSWGADLIIFERSGWNDNVQLAIGFLRGAGKEYGKPWTLEMSPWGGAHAYGRGPTTYNAKGVHIAGVSGSLHWFTWMTNLMAGAVMIRQQATEPAFFCLNNPTLFGTTNCDTLHTGFPYADAFRKEDPGRTNAALSPLGESAVKLKNLLERRDFERGEPIIPVAIMIALQHGWDGAMFTREKCVWAGKLPLERGDMMLYALFEFLLPGYLNAGRMMDPEFNPDFCFSSEYQMMEAMYAGFDLRPFEKGFFVPTPFGDSFDVITPHVAPEVLARYPLLILAGRLSMTPELFPLIRQYTEQGGTVILHSKGLGLDDPKVTSEYKDEIERFVGIKILGEYQPGFSPTLLTASNESFPEGKYEYMPVSATTAGMVAVNQEKPSYPIVTENAVGRGKALFCTPYHHLTLTGRDLLKGVKAALKAAVKPLIPVAIIGHPLYFQANKLKDGYLIALYNWDAIPWEGTVRLSAALENPQVSELFSFDQPTAAQAHGVIEFKAKVDKYQVALYRITGAPGRKVQPAGPRTRSGGHRHSAK